MIGDLLRGYLAISACGWSVRPLVAAALPGLPDRGAGVARLIGVCAAAWLAAMAATLAGRPLSTTGALATVAAIGAAVRIAPAVARRGAARASGARGGAAGRLPARAVLAGEIVFVAGLLLFFTLASRNPAVDPDSERFMDYAFFSASLRSPGVPVADPWLAGRTPGYYYFGYVLAAFLARLGGGDPAAFFTAAVAIVHALAWGAGFTAGVALTGRVRGGVLAAVLILGAGNYEWVRQCWRRGMLLPFDWFSPSRAIDGAITEFPWFSLLWGDLHPYVIALPLFLCGLGVALAWTRAAAAPDGRRFVASVALFTLCAGALSAVHPWDFPVLVAAGAALAGWGGAGFRPARAAVVLAAGACAPLLFAPFLGGLHSAGRGLALAGATTRPVEWLLAYGPFVALAAAVAVAGAPAVSGTDGAATGATPRRAAWIFAAGALGLAMACEVVRVEDLFGATPLRRMNTVFKLHRLAWTLAALGAAALLEPLVAAVRLPGPGRRRARAGACLAVAALAAAAVYPVAGTAAWWRWREAAASGAPDARVARALEPGARADRLFASLFPGDAAAAAYVARHAAPGEAVLEESGAAYTWTSRISTFSGVPAVLGWGNHEAVWRGGWDEVLRRRTDIDAMYGDPASAAPLLEKYGVSWVIFGERERTRYGAGGAAAWASIAEVAAEDQGTIVFGVASRFRVAPRRPSDP